MMRRSIRTTASWLCVAALAACAAPPAAVPPPVPGPKAVASPQAADPAPAAPSTSQPVPPAPQDPRLPSPAEELDSYALVRDDPILAVATADLAAAPPPARPAALLRRAREAFATARKLRAAQGGPFDAVWPPALERFLAYCDLAIRDLDELLVAHPVAPEAAEAMFTVGQIHDYPYLNLFDEALEAYRLTLGRYPGTPWARQAAERIAVIEATMGTAGKDSSHGAPAHQPAPPR